MRRNTTIALALFAAVVIAWGLISHQGVYAAGLRNCTVEGDRVIVTLEAGAYRITGGPEGRHIEMEGFGDLMVPGAPMLPMKRFLIALPPGARALSVEIIGTQTRELTGIYDIDPFPGIRFLPGMPRLDEAMERLDREWRATNEAVYHSDSPFPGEAAWISGKGTLRKYSYAALAFCPFTYYPESGRLAYHTEIEVAISCELPYPDELQNATGGLLLDTKADDQASTVFENYREIAHLYRTEMPEAPPLSPDYDYVIVTTSGLAGAVASSDFPTWKTAIGCNLRTVLITDTEITSQPGTDLAEQIRNFLRAYYATWGIEYVLIVGDYATVPMRICYPDPSFHVYDPSDPGLVAPGTPTDYYYADLSYPDAVSWDSDGDGYLGEYGQDDPDFLAEVAVGRIPVNDLTRITYTLDKLAAFEQDTGAWKANVLHAGSILFFENQDYSGYPFLDGAVLLDSMETGLMGSMSITHMTERAGLVPSLFSWPAISEAAFTSAWGDGEYAYVNWSGHGWSDGAYRTVWNWDDGDGVPEHGNGEMQSYRFIGTGAANLDDDHPSIVFAVSCNVGYPDPNPYGNLGIDLLTLPGWGSSAGIASSSRPAAVAGDWKATGGGTEQICYEFNRHMISLGEKVGDALYDGKFYATANYGWDHIYEYMNLYNYNLYGDPALEVGGATAGVADHVPGSGRSGIHLSCGEPNPFRQGTALRFKLTRAARVSVTVHDVTGRQVAALAEGDYSPGEHLVTWNGADDNGGPLAPGLYFVAASAGSETAVRKAVLLK
jgi:hypothetical protein